MTIDDHDKLLAMSPMPLSIWGREGGTCSVCDRDGSHYRVVPCFMLGQRLELLICQRCLDRVSNAVHEPLVARFLALAIDDALKTMARITLALEDQKKKVQAQGWEEAVAILVRAVDSKQGSVANKIALMNAVRGLTGLGLGETKSLVERGMERAQRPLELPPDTPGPKPALAPLPTGNGQSRPTS